MVIIPCDGDDGNGLSLSNSGETSRGEEDKGELVMTRVEIERRMCLTNAKEWRTLA